MKLLDKIVVSKTKPKTTQVLWIEPQENNEEKPRIKVFMGGKWEEISEDLSNYLTKDALDNYYTITQVDSKFLGTPTTAGTAGQILSLNDSGKTTWTNPLPGSVVDTEMSDVSPNPVQNSTIKNYVDNGLALGAVYDVSAKNPTAGPNNDGKWESLSALLSDANLDTLIPASVRKGGMSIKFVCSSDNKYVEYLYNNSTSTDADDFTNVANWEKLNLEEEVSQVGQDADYRQSRTPAHIFRNLFDKTDPSIVDGYFVNYNNGELSANASYVSTGYIPVIAGYDYYMSHKHGIAWYDKDKVFISGSAQSDMEKVQTAPNGAAFLRCTITSAKLDDFIVAQSSVAVAYVPYGKIKASEIDGVLSDSNIPETIARKEDAVLKKLGVNLFDQSAITDKKFLASDGTLSYGSNYETSDYIPVTAGGGYFLSDTASILSNSTYVCFYDASKAFVSSVQSASGIAMAITIPSGCAYVRFSLVKANIRKPQFELGNARTKYFSYSIIGGYAPQIADETVYSESIVPGAITSDKVVDKAIGIKQTSIVSSANMLDKEDADVAMGKYVGPTDGTLHNNAGYNTSGFIGVLPGKTYYFGSLRNTVSPRFYALYNSTKVFVAGGNDVSFITIPAGCYYIRFSLTTTQWGNESAQMTLGSVLPYSVYEVVLDPSIGLGTVVKKFDSALGNAAHTLTKATLTDGETLTDLVFPRFQLKGLVMSMACKISTMGTLIVGKGYQQRLGQYLRISSTTVEFIRCNLEGTESVRDTATHGLTIADFLRVSLYYIGNGYLRYIISTSSGYFQKDVNWSYYGEYDPFVKSTGTSASDVKLSIGSRDLKKPIWCFGDSYQSVSDNRWPGVLRNIGCFEFMINALTGINSVNALADAIRAFSFGTPKLAFWGLGMNDASDADASTPNENWLTSIQSFIDLCKANDTEPILVTIPCTPAKNHEGKNAWVRASGYRYIDIADAVGGTTFTSGVDTWYSGMLSEDEVHPTELGAQAQASRVLADLPEIMQQNHDIDYVS